MKSKSALNLTFGIDLGTTNSSISYCLDSNGSLKIDTLDIEQLTTNGSIVREPLLPSYFYFDVNSNRYYVGKFAKEKFKTEPSLVIRSVKSDIGPPKVFNINGKSFTPEEISSYYLKKLKETCKNFLRKELDGNFAIAVPASFDDIQRRATLKAAEMAGLTVRDSKGKELPILIDEPRASLYSFVHDNKTHIFFDQKEDPKTILVYDLGGGTLDVSLHELRLNSDDTIDIEDLEISRYTKIGGDNFDEIFADWILTQYIKQNPAANFNNLSKQRKFEIKQNLFAEAEAVKIRLAEQYFLRNLTSPSDGWGEFQNLNEISVNLRTGFLIGNYNYNTEITSSRYEEIIYPLLGKGLSKDDYEELDQLFSREEQQNIVFPILDVFSKANSKREDPVKVDYVLITGGMTNFPLIKKRLIDFLEVKEDQILSLVDPEKSVSRGAAIYARNIALGKKIQTVTAESISVKLIKDQYSVLIPSGTKLPYNGRVKDNYTLANPARFVKIPLYKGNIDRGLNPTKIAEFSFDLGKAFPEGEVVQLNYQMDVSKILIFKANLKSNPEIEFEGKVNSTYNQQHLQSNKKKTTLPKPVVVKPKINLNQTLNHYKNVLANLDERNSKKYESEILRSENGWELIKPLLIIYKNKRTLGSVAKKRLPLLISKLYVQHPERTEDKKAFISMLLKYLKPKLNMNTHTMTTHYFGVVGALGNLGVHEAESDLLNLIQYDEAQPIIEHLLINLGKIATTTKSLNILLKQISSKGSLSRKGKIIAITWSIGKLASLNIAKPISRIDFDPFIPILINLLKKELQISGKGNINLLRNIIFAFGEIYDSRQKSLKGLSKQVSQSYRDSSNAVDFAINAISTKILIRYNSNTDNKFKQFQWLLEFCNTIKKMMLGQNLTQDEETTLLKIREDN